MRLQAVQNASARLITGSRRRDHITPILRQLHWLPVRQRIEFKLAMLVFLVLWNSLPVGLRRINLSIGQFRSALKTHLFN